MDIRIRRILSITAAAAVLLLVSGRHDSGRLFIVMCAAALFISSLTVRLKRQARQTAQRSYRTDILLETSQKLQKAESEEKILSLTAAQLMKLLERDLIV